MTTSMVEFWVETAAEFGAIALCFGTMTATLLYIAGQVANNLG